MKCPDCESALDPKQVGAVEVDCCADCGGASSPSRSPNGADWRSRGRSSTKRSRLQPRRFVPVESVSSRRSVKQRRR